jgi:hypothetical protein
METLTLLSLNLIDSNQTITNTAITSGIGIGNALAVSICWSETKSVLSSAIAGLFGWLYVIYYLLTRERQD